MPILTSFPGRVFHFLVRTSSRVRGMGGAVAILQFFFLRIGPFFSRRPLFHKLNCRPRDFPWRRRRKRRKRRKKSRTSSTLSGKSGRKRSRPRFACMLVEPAHPSVHASPEGPLRRCGPHPISCLSLSLSPASKVCRNARKFSCIFQTFLWFQFGIFF